MTGFHWQVRDLRRFAAGGIGVARILCETHHRLLSVLDECLKRIVEPLTDQRSDLHIVKHVSASGAQVERALLKVLCGQVASANASIDGKPTRWTVPESWVRVLFGYEDFGIGAGLYVASGPPQRDALAFTPIAAPSGPRALSVSVGGLDLLLAVDSPQGDQRVLRRAVYRPAAVELQRPDRTTSIALFWP